ncbi:hypothetical protein KQX54_019392 [Cotesia glomerata]|uniref:Uncharacterized protein n=1 Tax=Cotesia glomerata TaxID=32391 RepID=A0AAV7HYM9_COTGL|nr:hypothetical protein KQX54_019392 [Cotesia glomerata]
MGAARLVLGGAILGLFWGGIPQTIGSDALDGICESSPCVCDLHGRLTCDYSRGRNVSRKFIAPSGLRIAEVVRAWKALPVSILLFSFLTPSALSLRAQAPSSTPKKPRIRIRDF